MPLAVAGGLGARIRERIHWSVVPPIFLASAFIVVIAYRGGRYLLMPVGTVLTNRLSEYVELVLYGAILVMVWLAFRRLAERSAAGAHAAAVHSEAPPR